MCRGRCSLQWRTARLSVRRRLRGFRADARHWLAVSKAVEQEHPGGLSQEWKQRLDEALEDLNRDVYGGAERFDKSASTAVEHTTPAPGSPGPPPEVKCASDTDCESAKKCQDGKCVPL